MASTPDAHPDSLPTGPSDAPEQVTPPGRGGHDDIENVPEEPDSPGMDGGTAGTGGTNPNQDFDVTS
ncbi:MAG: hypothetical protein PGN09_01700 [Sphingomonas fennica]